MTGSGATTASTASASALASARASLRQPRARESFLGVRARPSRCRANALRNPSPRWLACPPLEAARSNDPSTARPDATRASRARAPRTPAPPRASRDDQDASHAPTDPDPDPDLADVELDRDRTLLTKMTSGSIDLDGPASSRTETGEIAATDSNPNEPEPRFLSRPGRDPGALFGARERAGLRGTPMDGSGTARARPVFGENELREVISLAVPALGSLLADPMMSLVDTAVVGRHGSTSLAALGPNTAVFQIVFQIFSFLSITTTGMVARACADGDNRTVRRALANSTILALAFGGATCVGLNVFAEDVLRVIGCSPDLVGAAAPYLRVRAFAIPAVLFCTSAQGGCLGQQDAKTPLLIFLCAGLVNVVGDVWAVSGSGLNLGLTGAAWATLAAQYFSAAVFLLVLSRKRMLPRRWSHWRLPTSGEMRDITSVSGMLLLGSLCRMGVYTMMTMTALALGTLTMAAHQVALQVFWTLTYFVDPLFVAATSFIARDHGRRPTRVRRMATTLMGLSLGVGCVIAVACAAIPTFAVGVFTADLELQALIRTITPLMGLSQLVSALVLVTEGVLIGCGDLKYLLNVHCLNFVVLGGVLCWVKHSSAGLWGIWIAVLMNQTLRMTQHGAHMWRGGGPDLFARDQTGEGKSGDGA